jgi:hypothetical protein
MTGNDQLWADVEVAVSQVSGSVDTFRVIFEQSGPAGRTRLATVYVEGGETLAVNRVGRTAVAEAAGIARVELERKALAVVRNLAEALVWD